jgi:hypothetical protein
VVMSNHYHLAVETPLGNLSGGMHYLQSQASHKDAVRRASLRIKAGLELI